MHTPKFSHGSSEPLGATPQNNGINFSLFAPHNKEVILGLFTAESKRPYAEIPLNRDGDYFHVFVENVPPNTFYAYKIHHIWVLDPFAKELNASKEWGVKPDLLLGKVLPETSFDWGEGASPNRPLEELIIYEMHVRGFTKDPSSKVTNPGTFLGVIEKIPHLLDLGINTVELLPIFEFDETAHPKPVLFNYWGYSPANFFAPIARYGTIKDFKTMVKALHQAGIEVILDVVYNHVGTKDFDHLSKSDYFILDQKRHHTNYTGCGNTINTNNPHTMHLILESLKYWTTEMHVDGFRFDLASIFCRGSHGEVLENPPIIEAMINENVLSKSKLIAEPWDSAGLYQVDSFPGNGRFGIWNGRYRDTVRHFIKGTDHQAEGFVSAVGGLNNFRSINFITAHDGFTLRDLVSYNNKHNKENGEHNRDGNNWNESWNCGVEGPTKNQGIIDLRNKQMRNFIFTLCFSIGTPMILMGDEYGHTRGGNNNAYALDNQKNYFLWDVKGSNFMKRCIQLRKEFLQGKGDFQQQDRLVSATYQNDHYQLFLAFNANYEPIDLNLPPSEKPWQRLIDTYFDEVTEEFLENHYYLHPHTCLLLKA